MAFIVIVVTRYVPLIVREIFLLYCLYTALGTTNHIINAAGVANTVINLNINLVME